MTHDAHSAPPAGAKASLDALFNRQRWAPVGRQTLFLLTALPLALVVPVTTIALVSVGAGLAVLGVGLLLLLGAAALARWFGDLELRRLAWAGAAPIEAPTSSTTDSPLSVGHRPAMAGRSMPSIILRLKRAIAIRAPVLPAETATSASPFLTASIASHIDDLWRP